MVKARLMGKMAAHGEDSVVARLAIRAKIGLLLLFLSVQSCQAADLGCSSGKYAHVTKGMDGLPLPRQPLSGTHLRICQKEETCCTEEMETHFNKQSRQEFDRILRETTDILKQTLNTRAHRFDEYFKDLLKTSKKDFHTMFVRTYGILYEQNSAVFTDLFDNLEKYHSLGNVNLADVLENFFLNLYQRMFQVLNAQYTFDQTFLNCMQEFMDDLKPFGDVPQKLTVQVKRAFVAAKTFQQGLVVGRDVVKGMMDVPPTSECSRALTKMTYCPHCQGLPDLKPCNSYCLNVMKGCLAYHAELDTDWNEYIDALIMLADRLEGPFNIELVVEPINIKISDAIMNFQENGAQVSNKIFENCGKPALGKRDVSHELNYDTLKFGRQDLSASRTAAPGTNLDRLVKDIRNKVKVARSFWTNLAYQMCNNDRVAATPTVEDECWNGLTKAKYEMQITGDGILNQKHNPEVNLDVNKPNSLLNQQSYALKMITNKLKNAYNGMDVDWPDDVDGSGSGSGSYESSGDGAPMEEASDPVFPPSATTTAKPDVHHVEPTRTTSSASKMGLRKAVDIFVLPIMVVWLGSVF